MRNILIVFGLIFFLLLPVGANPPSSLSGFVRKALKTGADRSFPKSLAKLLDLPENILLKNFTEPETSAVDNIYRTFQVIIEKSTPTKATALVWCTNYEWPGNSEAYYFRSTLTGKLEKAVYIYGKDDEKGNAIPGDGGFVIKDINSPEIKERFQKELDFWLQGRYRKKTQNIKKGS